MTCRDASDLLVDLLDGRLDGPAQVRLYDHLESCSGCRQLSRTLKRQVPSMRATAPPHLDEMHVRRMQVAVEHARTRDLGEGRRRLPVRVSAAVALMLASVAVWVGLRHSAVDGQGEEVLVATVRQSHGAAVLARGRVALSAEVGTPVSAGETLTVDRGGQVALVMARGSIVGLTGPGRLTLSGTGAAAELQLAEGILTAEVAHRRDNETFAVVIDGARVVVRGTRFTVAAQASGSWLRVDEGRVAVVTGAGERLVSAGQTVALSTPPEMRPEPVPAASQVESSPALAPTTEGSCASRRRCEVTAKLARRAMRARSYQRALTIVASAGEVPRPDSADPCSFGESSCHNELGYLKAEALRLDGRLNAAVAAYRELDRRGATPATRQNALYAAAQLEQRLGKLSAAVADYERARAAAPRGGLAEESLMGALESAHQQQDRDLSRALARRYLDEFPAGAGAALAQRILAGAPTTSSPGAR